MASRMPLGRLASRVARPAGARSFAAPRTAFQRRAYSSEAPKPSGSGIKFWPFFAIIGLGSLGYIGLVNRRKGTRIFEQGLP